MFKSPRLLLLAGTCAWLSSPAAMQAGNFFSDFNSGLPVGTAVYGNTIIDAIGGFTNSGCVKLTTNAASQNGGFIITNDLDAGQPVVSFTVNFKALIGGGNAADGLSFNFAPDLPLGTITEEGAGTGITVEFDTYLNIADPNDAAPSIDVKIGGVEIAQASAPGLRANTFVDVVIQLHPDGSLDVIYDGFYAHHNLPTGLTSITGGLFGFGARTGGQNDNHFIDNLSISTQTNAAAFVDYFQPVGRGIRADAAINIILTDNTTAVDTTKIVLKVDGVTVTPSVTQSAPNTTIHYVPPALFASGSTHAVNLVFADNATPTPNTNTLDYGFTVATYATLSGSLAADPSFVNLSSRGFATRYSQIADSGSREVTRAELQLANLLIDGSTSLPYDNLAAPNPSDSSFNYFETNVINYAFPAGSAGNFPSDTDVPGVPGPSTGTGSSYASDSVTYLHLFPGLYALGVNSSDGFKLTVADGADIFAPQEAIFSGVRAAADTTVSFSVTTAGYYPFRLVYFTGDPAYGPAPGTTLPSLEFFNIDSGGNKVLINDTNVIGYVPAFMAAKTKPYVRSVNPNIGDSGVPGNTAVGATLVDGSLKVLTNSILMQINGVTVAPTISSNAGVSVINFQPAAVFAPNSSNFVSLAFSDSGSNRRTNTWSFSVANIMSPVWSIAAVNNTWVTAGSTERGLAYNPKTGHLILTSRAAAPAPAGGLGIAILDSNNGSVLGTLNLGSGVIAGGTFAINMVDVADDGVIYVCNLSTSAAQNFRIYRWQNESATPTIAYDAPPTAAAGTPRWGDDFRVRGSGAGTQIIASGNNASANSLPIFTTVDGTNFTRTLLAPTGLVNNSVRLGIAWGCGNTFYGETTGTPMSYVGFNGIPSTIAALNATYGIYDKNTNQAIGPIGLDIGNQRLIANQTVAPHNINLYDLPSLVVTPTRNFPIDQRNYASQNTSFGTGSVDFTPDGSRVFCLDTGNGIIAFSLAPRPAAPAICAQPQNFTAPAGNIGFFGVTAIGSSQTYQWRYHGFNSANAATNIAGATNATLDTYYIQPTNLGYYDVVITNALGRQTSSVAYLDSTIIITNQPASQVVAIGGTASFNVGVTNGLPAYAYQWQYNGTNISGATSSSYSTNNVQVSNAGGYTVTIADSLGQSVTSQVAVLTVGTVGTGTGLTGDYYTSHTSADPYSGVPTLSRLDTTVDFEWGTGSPDASISADTFTVRWYGKVQPFYSQTYTFYTTSDDGVRLWINGQNVINSWINQAPTERSGTITLTANQKYDVVLEYFENAGGASAHLSWGSPAQFKQIIPRTQLYPGTPPLYATLSSGLVNQTNLVLNWSGTFNLESAPDVTGPWTPVAGPITGPYTNIIDGSSPRTFFRLQGTD